MGGRGMKIIKQGKTKEELKAIFNETKRFECRTCGCVFEANKDEYEYEDDYIYSAHYCKCPNCGQRVREVKMM
jgi:Zn finger protein HypA/HybF involved in hydrogenase expression